MSGDLSISLHDTHVYIVCCHANRPGTETDIGHLLELHVHYAGFIANIIKSFPEDHSRHNLLSRELRKKLFEVLSEWSGTYWSPDPYLHDTK